MPTAEPRAPRPPVAPDPAIFDAEVLGAMFDHDAALVGALLQTFVTSTNASLAEMSLAVADKHLTSVVALAHRIAGASRLSGASSFGDLAARVETAAKVDDLTTVQTTLDVLLTQWQQLRFAIAPLLPPPG